MIVRLSTALDLPYRERNVLLRAAGFAGLYKQSELESEDIGLALRAFRRLMERHNPYPTFLLDRSWRILEVNESGSVFLSFCQTDVPQHDGLTVFDLFFDPAQLRPLIANWSECARHSIQRLHRESLELSDAEAIMQRLRRFPDVPEDWWAYDGSYAVRPVVPVQFRVGTSELSVFSLVTSLGTPTDVTSQELRLETLFPADKETERTLKEFSLKNKKPG